MIHIISPHIDDAIFSLGGTILKLKDNSENVLIHYIFTISDWTNSNNCSGKLYSKNKFVVTNIRKQEEEIVSKRVGYKYIMYDYYDMPLRSGDDVSASEIQDALLDKINKEDIIFFPIGIGHPDHERIREVGISLFYMGFNTLFYEDMPYIAHYDYHTLFHLTQRKGFEAETLSICLEKKLSLARIYKSQVSDQWLKDIKNYAYNLEDNKFYERFWKPKGSMHVSIF